mmetsp:Transcript_7764/g.31457  ORF Transcript_7764/g.31457 Transcript_7764/m.31457 type:complete len:880 (+) Transcript_7764:122-2761(+)
MHGARRRGDYGGGARQKSGTPSSPGPSKPTTFEELNRLLQSRNRSLSTRINSVLQVLEENRDNLRGFFAACYQTLLWQIFNFDDGANGWLQSASSGNERDAWLLLDFLSPNGQFMKAVLAADADGLMQFAFPLERLPERTQRMLRADPAALNARLPYRNCVQRDAHGRAHVHLGLYHYFLFWSAYYACSSARSPYGDGGGGRGRNPYGYGHSGHRSGAWMDWPMTGLGGRQRQGIQPYRELLLSHLRCFLPRGDEADRGGAWGSGSQTPGAGWPRGPGDASYRRANRVGASQGEMLVSIMAEFWLPGANEGQRGGQRANEGMSPYASGIHDGRSNGAAGRHHSPSSASPYPQSMSPLSSMQRQYSYNPPSDDLVNAVNLLVTYLYAEPADVSGGVKRAQPSGGAQLAAPVSPRSPRSPRTPANDAGGGSAVGASKRVNASRSGGSPGVQDLGVDAEVERAKEMLQKPLYKFLREAFVYWPNESTANLGPVMNLWVTYMMPWTLSFPAPHRRRSGSGGSPTSRGIEKLSRGIEAVQAVAADIKSNSPKFVGDRSPLSSSASPRRTKQPLDEMHVLRNVPFYCELMKHFLELCCNRVPVDAEGTATALYSVLRSLASCPEAVRILEQVEAAFNEYAPVDPFAPGATAKEPPAPTPYDDFLPYIHEQIMDWDPPETTNQDPMATATPMRAPGAGRGADPFALHGAAKPPAVSPKFCMFTMDQEGLPQVALALLERLDRDMAHVGPSHSLRQRVPKLRKAAFTVFSLERLGESVTARATFSTELNKPESRTGGNRSGKNAIGWARLGKSQTTSKQLYRGDWNTRPIHDMEFPPLARLLIALSEELNSGLGLEGEKRISLRVFAEYGSMLGLSFLMLLFWLFFG